jgi:hypothetical protein
MPELTAVISNDAQKQLVDQIAQYYPQKQGGADNVVLSFCNSWPGVRAGLDGLRTILSLIPGVNVFAGPAITIVLAAGDAAKAALCK